MEKLIVLLLLCFLRTVQAKEIDDKEPETSPQERTDEDLESADKLAEIGPSEVLPLIFIIYPDHLSRYNAMPTRLVRYELTDDGKISNGTKFAALGSGAQTFFCPRDQENSQNRCLARRKFQGSDPLRCTSQPSPEWISKEGGCGLSNKHTIFEMVYKVCESEEHPHDPKVISFYKICYDASTHKTLYTSHEIMSPGLLSLNLLARERSMNYLIATSDGPIFAQHPILNDALMQGATISANPSYQLQNMVRPEDMAFATGRKTTFNNLNYEWQHQELIDLWNEISKNITSAVQIKHKKFGRRKFYVDTAIVDVTNSSHQVGGQLPNIWMKMVYVTKLVDEKRQLDYGTVILMNNFVDKSVSAEDRKTSLTDYCFDDFCIEELAEKFNKIGGAILCCEITEKVANIFGFQWSEMIKDIPIPNVTVTKDQETLRDPVTPVKAAESLRKIQREEMLPLTLLHDNFSRYKFPTSVVKIETKNGRIVQGSEFSSSLFGESRALEENNVSFCPKKDPEEKCLVAQRFGKYKPLECATEADPIVRKLEEDVKCGFNGSGVIRNVVYEICATTESGPVDMKFYKVCYDNEKKNRSLSTYHQILFPSLMSTNLLLREQAMDHFNEITSSQEKPGYRLQKLVPSEDMAFGIWKKTTYERINADWQHRALIPLWDEINNRIRNHYISKHIHNQKLRSRERDNTAENHVYTGVFDIHYEFQDSTDAQESNQHSTDNQESNQHSADDQESTVWVKIVYTRSTFLDSSEAVVILMNNFLVSGPSSDSPNSKENIIRKYCVDSLCLKKVEEEFESIGGRIRCCRLTAEIAHLFNMQNVNEDSGELFNVLSTEGLHTIEYMHIPDITK